MIHCNQDKLSFGIDAILSNSRIPENIKNHIRSSIQQTDEFVCRAGLIPYFAGISSIEEVKNLIPPCINIGGIEYNYHEIYNKLLQLSLIDDKKLIRDKIRDKIYYFIDEENFEKNLGEFKFIDAKLEKDKILTNQGFLDYNWAVLENYDKYLPKVWINSLSLLALIKWQYYSQTKDEIILNAISKLITWLNNNRYYIELYGWAEYLKGFSTTIKIFETCLSLQTLLKAKKIKYLQKLLSDFNLDFDFTEIDFKKYADAIVNFQKEGRLSDGRFPSDIIYGKEDDKFIVRDYYYIGDTGSTCSAIQFLLEYINNIDNIDEDQQARINESLMSAKNWLIEQQDKKSGAWRRDNKNSIEFTTNAIQSLLKYKNSSLEDSDVQDAIILGLSWLRDQFCIVTNNNNNLIYAWPKEDNVQCGCEKNTAYAVSTLLKANVNYESFVIRKAVLWLLDASPQFGFDNVYIYCAVLDYLKSMEQTKSEL